MEQASTGGKVLWEAVEVKEHAKWCVLRHDRYVVDNVKQVCRQCSVRLLAATSSKLTQLVICQYPDHLTCSRPRSTSSCHEKASADQEYTAARCHCSFSPGTSCRPGSRTTRASTCRTGQNTLLSSLISKNIQLHSH